MLVQFTPRITRARHVRCTSVMTDSAFFCKFWWLSLLNQGVDTLESEAKDRNL